VTAHDLAHHRVTMNACELECSCGATFEALTERQAFADLRRHLAANGTRRVKPKPADAEQTRWPIP
jgi:hypothetical protein